MTKKLDGLQETFKAGDRINKVLKSMTKKQLEQFVKDEKAYDERMRAREKARKKKG